MNLNLFKSNLALISGLVGFTVGSVSSASYYQRQLIKERQAFLECQQAWEKYYQLDQPTNQLLIDSTSLSQKLNTWGLKISSRLVYAVGYLVQNQWPEFRLEKQSIFSREQQKYLVYHYEILPKCSNLKDWEKYMTSLSKN